MDAQLLLIPWKALHPLGYGTELVCSASMPWEAPPLSREKDTVSLAMLCSFTFHPANNHPGQQCRDGLL